MSLKYNDEYILFCVLFTPYKKRQKADASTSNIVSQNFKFFGQKLGKYSNYSTLYFSGDITKEMKQIYEGIFYIKFQDEIWMIFKKSKIWDEYKNSGP